MLVRKTTSEGIMFSIQLHILLILTMSSAYVKAVTFDSPPTGGVTINVSENASPGSRLYGLQASDPGGNTPSFTIDNSQCVSTSTPSSIINFTIDRTNDQLLVPKGLDVDICSQYKLIFRVTAGGSSATSGPLTIVVLNVNNHPPRFRKPSYYGVVWKNDKQNQAVVNESNRIQADDPDNLTTSITLKILGAQKTFDINASGIVYVSNNAGLSVLQSPTVLTIQASDGLNSTTTLSITVNDDPCSRTPCRNGGTCNSSRNNYNCTCLRGYLGDRCERVDYCLSAECKNGGKCYSVENGYKCYCKYPYAIDSDENKNCTVLNYCHPEQCSNGAICRSLTDDFECECSFCLNGKKCEKEWCIPVFGVLASVVVLAIIGAVYFWKKGKLCLMGNTQL